MSSKARRYMHTPGNWYAVGSWIEHDELKVPDIAVFDPRYMDQNPRSEEEMCANAHLCANAPWMVDELERIANAAQALANHARSVIDAVTTPYVLKKRKERKQ